LGALKGSRHRMRFSNDLERIRRVDSNLKDALDHLRKCDNSDRVLPLIAGIRRLRAQLEIIFENALPKSPGEENKNVASRIKRY
jgi:hypothetical protein